MYDFINVHVMPEEFNKNDCLHAKLEDLMKVQKVEKEKQAAYDNVLPSMVRDYIIHDRGNSLFLSESFGNLPSPVNETKTIKNLFKAKDDDDLDKRNKQGHSKEFNKNKEIKIEGKSMDSEEEKEEKTMVDIDVRDIDKIVFNGEPKRDSNVTY